MNIPKRPFQPHADSSTSGYNPSVASYLNLPIDELGRRDAFLKHLADGQCILFDGSTPTVLYERGIFINRSFDEVNLSSPDLVAEVQSDYLAAGAQVLTTNTWGANAVKLKAYGLEEKMAD